VIRTVNLLLVLSVVLAVSVPAPVASQALLFKERHARSSKSLSAHSNDNSVISTADIRLSPRFLKRTGGRFSLELNGVKLSASPNPVGVRGTKRAASPKRVQRVYTGSLNLTDNQDELDYGWYIITEIHNRRSGRSLYSGSIKTPDARYYSFISDHRAKRQRGVLLTLSNDSDHQCGTEQVSLPDISAPGVHARIGAQGGGTPPIRVLVAYTRSALAQMGNDHAQILAVANFEMTRLAQAAEDSNLGYTFEMAGNPYFIDEEEPDAHPIFYLYTRGEPEQYGEDIFNQIDTRNADIVHLLVHQPDASFSGVAYGPKSFSLFDNRRSAFCTSNINFTFGGLSRLFAHETGHLLGGTHDPDNAPAEAGLYPDARGHHLVGNNGLEYATIMSYSRVSTDDSLHQFSAPEISYLGAATGVAGQRDNARLMRVVGSIVAQYKDYPISTPSGNFDLELKRGPTDTWPKLEYKFHPDSLPTILQHGTINVRHRNPDNNSEQNHSTVEFSTEKHTFEIAQKGLYRLNLHPDMHIKSDWIDVVAPQEITLSIQNKQQQLVGKALSGVAPVVYSGNWISIVKSSGSGVHPVVATVPVNKKGEFYYTPTSGGVYAAAHYFFTSYLYSNWIEFSVESPEPKPEPEDQIEKPGSDRSGHIQARRKLIKSSPRRVFRIRSRFFPSDDLGAQVSLALECDGSVLQEKVSKPKGVAAFRIRAGKKPRRCMVKLNSLVASKEIRIPRHRRARRSLA